MLLGCKALFDRTAAYDELGKTEVTIMATTSKCCLVCDAVVCRCKELPPHACNMQWSSPCALIRSDQIILHLFQPHQADQMFDPHGSFASTH